MEKDKNRTGTQDSSFLVLNLPSLSFSDIYKCARHLTKWGDLLPDPEHRERPVKSSPTRSVKAASP